MGTRSVVAIRQENGGWKGRYVQWDGYPEGVGESVKAIIARDGREKAVHTLIETHWSWSSVDANDEQPLSVAHQDGRFEAVPGYGIAHTDLQYQDDDGPWITSDNAGESWCEWAHVIEPDGSVTHIAL